MPDLHTRLMILRRQREARHASADELALLDELADALTHHQVNWIMHEHAANALLPPLPSIRQELIALRDELRAELPRLPAGARVSPAEVIHRVTGRLDALIAQECRP